jgi:CheY-like chemotaxis protein
MLEQFVIKLDDTCYQLHARMVADETAYVTTTTRLAHLIQVTQELVGQLGDRSHTTAVISSTDSLLPRKTKSADTVKAATLQVAKKIAPSLDEAKVDDVQGVAIVKPIEAPPASIQLAPIEKAPVQQAPVNAPVNLLREEIEFRRELRRVLIVEPSMFYRQMIGMAVKTMGYDADAVETAQSGVAALAQPKQFCAVLVDAIVAPAMAEVLAECRRDHGIKVIGMTSTSAEGSESKVHDDLVAKSNPRQLREILTRLMNDAAGDARKSA